MLLQSLYEFAKNTKTPYGDLLINSAEFESRYVAWLIHIDENGVFKGFIPLIPDEDFGNLFDKLPRTLEPKDSGTVAEFFFTRRRENAAFFSAKRFDRCNY